MEQHCACKKSAERPGALLRMTLDVVREKLGLPDVARGQIQIFPLPLPSEKSTALVDVVFSELNCRVSLMAPRCIHIEINKVDGEHTETVEFPPVVGKTGLPDFQGLRRELAKKHACAQSAAGRIVTFEIEQVERHVDQPVRVVRCKMCWRRLLLKSALRIVKLLDGETVLRHACALGMEGNLSKRRDAPYRSGRQETWIKLKSTPSRSSLLSKSWAHAPIQRAGAAASFKAIVAVPFLNKPPFRSHR